MENKSNAVQSNDEVAQSLEPKSNFELLSSLELSQESNGKSKFTKDIGVSDESETKIKSKEESKEESKADVLTEAPTPEVKKALVKFLAENKEFEVPEDGIIPVKINGKEETVLVKDLIRNYQGKIPWEKHYRELKEEKKRFEDDVKAIDTQIASILNLVNGGKQLDALRELVKLSGKNPAEVLPAEAFLSREEIDKLDDAAKQEVRLKKYYEFEREKIETEKKKLEEQKNKADLDNYFLEKKREHNITDDELDFAAEVIENSEIDLSKKSLKEIIDLTTTFIVDIHRKQNKVVNAVKRVDPALVKDAEFIGDISKLVTSDFTEDDIYEVISEVVGTKKEVIDKKEDTDKELEKEEVSNRQSKASKDSLKKTPSRIPQKKAREETEDDDPISFNDLLKPYR